MRSNQGPDASLQEHKAGSTKGENTCAYTASERTINTFLSLSTVSGVVEQSSWLAGLLGSTLHIIRSCARSWLSRAPGQGVSSAGALCECLRCCRPGSSGRGFDSGAGSGSGGDGEAGTEEVGTPRAGVRAPKGKRKRSNLGQAQVKACAAHSASHIPRRTAHKPVSIRQCTVVLSRSAGAFHIQWGDRDPSKKPDVKAVPSTDLRLLRAGGAGDEEQGLRDVFHGRGVCQRCRGPEP